MIIHTILLIYRTIQVLLSGQSILRYTEFKAKPLIIPS